MSRVPPVQLAARRDGDAPVVHASLPAPSVVRVTLHRVAVVVHQQGHAAQVVRAHVIFFVCAPVVHHHRRQTVRRVDVAYILNVARGGRHLVFVKVNPCFRDIARAVLPYAFYPLAVHAVGNQQLNLAVVVRQSRRLAKGVVFYRLCRAWNVVLTLHRAHCVRATGVVTVCPDIGFARYVAVARVVYGLAPVQSSVVV